MLKAYSPLGENATATFDGLVLNEKLGVTLTLISGTQAQLKKDLGALPGFGRVMQRNGSLLLRQTFDQIWCLGDVLETKNCHQTTLSSSRTCIEIAGEKARALLATSAAVDFSSSALQVDHFVLTGMHHTPVLIHCVAENGFHLYVMRTLALSMWQWLNDAAEGLM
jgi:sarcosine oxidase subunit gamma